MTVDWKVHLMAARRVGITLYAGPEMRARFVSFHPGLHTGWRSYPMWMPGGWYYTQSAFLIGRQGSTREPRWFKLPTVLIPERFAEAWRMTRPGYAQARWAIAREQIIREASPLHGNSSEEVIDFGESTTVEVTE